MPRQSDGSDQEVCGAGRLSVVVFRTLAFTQYLQHYNTVRPHRSLDLDVPVARPTATVTLPAATRVKRVDVLDGLIHEYRHAA